MTKRCILIRYLIAPSYLVTLHTLLTNIQHLSRACTLLADLLRRKGRGQRLKITEKPTPKTKKRTQAQTPFITVSTPALPLTFRPRITRPSSPWSASIPPSQRELQERPKMSPSTTTTAQSKTAGLSLPLSLPKPSIRDQSPSASGSRTPRPKTLTPSPPVSRRQSMAGGESDMGVLLRTIDFAARVSPFLIILGRVVCTASSSATAASASADGHLLPRSGNE